MGRTRGIFDCCHRDSLPQRNGVTIRAMGAAIEKAVRLAVELQRRNYSLKILTGTAEVVDDVIPDDNVRHPCHKRID